MLCVKVLLLLAALAAVAVPFEDGHHGHHGHGHGHHDHDAHGQDTSQTAFFVPVLKYSAKVAAKLFAAEAHFT